MTLTLGQLYAFEPILNVSSSSPALTPVVDGQDDDQILQDDPCLSKSRVVGDVQYCDRYWECTTGDPELYDCPNGLVWIGKNQGIADGCDYPWRHPNICKDKNLASKYKNVQSMHFLKISLSLELYCVC